MTREKIIEAISDDKTMPFIQPDQLANIVDFVIKNSKPSLPSNLDEAAKQFQERWDNDQSPEASFKAGAEWIARQGETHETEIVSRINAKGLLPAVTCLVDNSYKEGDKVVVQIRKK